MEKIEERGSRGLCQACGDMMMMMGDERMMKNRMMILVKMDDHQEGLSWV